MTNNVLAILPTYLFYVVTAIGGVGWFSLIFFPRRHWANYWVAGVVIPSILGTIYTGLMLVYWFYPPSSGWRGFIQLDNVYEMFANQGLLLAAWTDILLLSLIAGAWVTRKAVQMRMPYMYLLPLLFLMFAFPGTGIVAFFIVNGFAGRTAALSQSEDVAPTETAPVAAVPSAARG
ncbi:MAG TPA: abscisic acid-deficient protein Aba4 family protein [Thermoanaerobaculia bacterium]|nr:abscisic acid-deficient protein Aba4 family protein [Thermoanaerobaculia bacterium]